MVHPISIELFGHLAVRNSDEQVTRFRTQKTACLLAYLACYSGRDHPREELIEQFWPEVDLESGRTSLRSALASLRRQIAPPDAPENSILMADRHVVRLNSATVQTDVSAFEAALHRARRSETPAQQAEALSKAIELYRGPLLPGFYEDWVLRERLRFEQAFSEALRSLVDALEGLGDFDRAIQMALRRVAVDPLTEDAHLALMRLYAVTGQASSVRRQFREWERLAETELGDRPSAQARALLQHLLQNMPFAPTKFPTGVPTARAARSLPSVPPSSPPLEAESPGPVGRSSRLPLQLTRFFGREQEIAQTQELLRARETRLLTLTGPGGTGKTRLALEVAQRLAPEWKGAVWFVPLADITDAEMLPDALAKALCLPLNTESDATEQIAEALSYRPTLLVLDNFEQLPDAAAEMVHRLLIQIPDLACLVTSRQRLGLGGEQEFPLGPLPLPPGAEAGGRPTQSAPVREADASSFPAPAALLAFPSVQMFVDRARQARPDFQLTPANAATVARLCQALEGIPLAIELTAAWAQTLTPAQMLQRLHRRFDLLTSRRKDLPPRHRTLRATLEWSFRLLSPALQRCFARLSVFRGGWTLEAAEEVCRDTESGRETGEPWDSPDEEPFSLLLPLALLAERSLILTEESGEGMRYRQLEMLREYGQEQLSAADLHALRVRHLAYVLHLAEEGERFLFGADQVRWMDRLEQEHENVRAALRFCHERGDREAGLRLAGALTDLWHRRGYAREGRQWLETFVAHSTDVSPPVLAKALLGMGRMQYLLGPRENVLDLYAQSFDLYQQAGDKSAMARVLQKMHEVVYFHLRQPDRAIAQLERSLALCREVGDLKGIAEALSKLGNMTRDQGDYAQADSLYAQSLALNRQIGDRFATAQVLGDRGYMYSQQGDYRRAIEVLQEGLVISRVTHHRTYTGHLLWLLGRVKEMQGEYGAAQSLLEEAVQVGRQSGDQQQVFNAITNLAIVAELQQNDAVALTRYTEALEVGREMGNRWAAASSLFCMARIQFRLNEQETSRTLCQQSLSLWRDARQAEYSISECLLLLAQIALAQNEMPRAARLLGAAEARREALPWPVSAEERARYATFKQACQAVLGAIRTETLWAEGRLAPSEILLALALSDRAEP